MKLKSILFNFFIPLLTFVLVICLPSLAQEKASIKKAPAQSQKSKKQSEVSKYPGPKGQALGYPWKG